MHTGYEVLIEKYFADCWQSARDFSQAAHASPNLLLNIIIMTLINCIKFDYSIILKKTKGCIVRRQ